MRVAQRDNQGMRQNMCVNLPREPVRNCLAEKRHKHARRARVIIWELKAPGGSNTQWTLKSYDEVNPKSLAGYGVQRKKY